jgi:hypothetical protein
MFLPFLRNWDSVAGIVTVYRLDGQKAGVQVLVGLKVSILHVQTSSGVHPTSCPMGFRELLPGGLKRLGREADHSPPASAEVKKILIYTSTPPYAFMV